MKYDAGSEKGIKAWFFLKIWVAYCKLEYFTLFKFTIFAIGQMFRENLVIVNTLSCDFKFLSPKFI